MGYQCDQCGCGLDHEEYEMNEGLCDACVEENEEWEERHEDDARPEAEHEDD